MAENVVKRYRRTTAYILHNKEFVVVKTESNDKIVNILFTSYCAKEDDLNNYKIDRYISNNNNLSGIPLLDTNFMLRVDYDRRLIVDCRFYRHGCTSQKLSRGIIKDKSVFVGNVDGIEFDKESVGNNDKVIGMLKNMGLDFKIQKKPSKIQDSEMNKPVPVRRMVKTHSIISVDSGVQDELHNVPGPSDAYNDDSDDDVEKVSTSHSKDVLTLQYIRRECVNKNCFANYDGDKKRNERTQEDFVPPIYMGKTLIKDVKIVKVRAPNYDVTYHIAGDLKIYGDRRDDGHDVLSMKVPNYDDPTLREKAIFFALFNGYLMLSFFHTL